MAKSRIGAINEQFQEKVMPIFLSWGLERHPSDSACFGRDEHGYDYEFADAGDLQNVKLCSFGIFQKNASLAIDAAKGLRLASVDSHLPMLHTDPQMQTFRLARSLTRRFFKDFFDVSFRLEQRKDETLESAAFRLIEDVVKELPRLKRYLYG